MIPPSFEYLTPSNISDAVALLQKHGDEAKILAGGLLPKSLLHLHASAARQLHLKYLME